MSSLLSSFLVVGMALLSMGCKRGSVKSYESDFKDSIRAEFELGTGHIDHQKIDELLRSKRIGFVDGTMWSGPSHGADYTELRVDLKSINPESLIGDLLEQKLIAGDPIWLVNGVEFKPANKAE